MPRPARARPRQQQWPQSMLYNGQVPVAAERYPSRRPGKSPGTEHIPALVKPVSRGCHPGPHLYRLSGWEAGLQSGEGQGDPASPQLASKAARATTLKIPVLCSPTGHCGHLQPELSHPRLLPFQNELSLSGAHRAPLPKALFCPLPLPSLAQRKGGCAPETPLAGLARLTCCYNCPQQSGG